MVSTCQHGGGNRPGEGKVSSAGKEGVEPAYSEGFRRVFTDKGLSNGGRTACRVCHPHVSVSESTSRELQTSAAACVLAKARGHEGRAHNGEEGMLALRSTSARERARGGGQRDFVDTGTVAASRGGPAVGVVAVVVMVVVVVVYASAERALDC